MRHTEYADILRFDKSDILHYRPIEHSVVMTGFHNFFHISSTMKIIGPPYISFLRYAGSNSSSIVQIGAGYGEQTFLNL